MILLKQADVYSPVHLGRKDVLVCGGRIEAMGDEIQPGNNCQVVDAAGKILVPGLIDCHEHITGGGGEGGFFTRTPEVCLSSLIRSGITTVVGLLGTDDMTRSVEALVAKAKALETEGITTYTLCGAYGYPSPTITGSVKKDIVYIDNMLGVKLALSDHRAPNVTLEELIRLASDVRTAGMISGKAGIVVLLMGSGVKRLDLVFEDLKQTNIPAKTFHPTHMTRSPELFREGMKLAKLGGYVDITCESFDESKERPGYIAGLLREAKEAGVPMDHITLSSDGQGSWSTYDAYGNLEKIGVTSVRNLYDQLVALVKEDGFELTEALSYFTENVARSLEIYPKKGCIAEGTDGDLLLLKPDLSLDTVIAKGNIMMEGGTLLVRGAYEHD